jgi:hypothetical protein
MSNPEIVFKFESREQAEPFIRLFVNNSIAFESLDGTIKVWNGGAEKLLTVLQHALGLPNATLPSQLPDSSVSPFAPSRLVAKHLEGSKIVHIEDDHRDSFHCGD